jgi:hypothetical protein
MTTVKESTDRCDISKVGVGSVWTRHDSGEVTSIVGTTIYLKNNKGDEWNITAPLVSSQFSFADQWDEDIKVTRTEMINILKSNRQTAMTVVYHKKPDGKKLAEILKGGQGEMTDRAWLIQMNKLVLGEERTMIGHHFGSFDEHERLRFREHGKGQRLIDTRTLKRVVVNCVNYTIK